MPVSFTGLVAHRNPANLSLRAEAGGFDTAYLKQLAQAHKAGGFDRLLIGYGSTQPDGLHLGTYVRAVTEKLGAMLAHRPGFVAPTLAARSLATIDQLYNGRASVHTISRGSDEEQHRKGDFSIKKSAMAARQRLRASPARRAILRHWWAPARRWRMLLLDYYDLGISTFLIRGFDPLEDAIQYGEELIPLVQEAVANRPARSIAA